METNPKGGERSTHTGKLVGKPSLRAIDIGTEDKKGGDTNG